MDDALYYVNSDVRVQEVILTGGDPLMLSDSLLGKVLAGIRTIRHVDIVRIHTRTVSALPLRITYELARLLSKYHPLYLNIHVNHPDEVTCEFKLVAGLLADQGIPLGSQTVLLNGVNNNVTTLRSLYRKLVASKVRPYYFHHLDRFRGAGHFSAAIEEGIGLLNGLRGCISGMCIPHYVFDLPYGGGKVPLTRDTLLKCGSGVYELTNYQGRVFRVAG